MKSIIYVRLPCQKIYPGGVIALADFIHKANPDVRQKILDLSLVEKNRRGQSLLDEISEFEPDIIAFSWRDIQIFAPHQDDSSILHAFNFYYSKGLTSKIKASLHGASVLFKYNQHIRENLKLINTVASRFAGKKIVLGGPAFSVFSEQLIKKVPEGVIGVVGEGELALQSVVNGEDFLNYRTIFKKDGHITRGKNGNYLDIGKNTPTDFDYISSIFPSFNSYLGEQIGIQTKRGCTQKCLFCLYRLIEGPKIRYRNPKVVADEAEYLHKNFGVKKVWLTDATFCPNKASVPLCEETLEALIKKNLLVEWQGYVRIENLNPSFAKKMVQSGLGTLELSIASGSQKIVDNLHLGFEFEDFYKACRMLKEAGYNGKPVLVNYSLNAPGETEDTLRQSIQSLNKLDDIFGHENVEPYIFFLAVQHKTGLEKLAIKEKLLKPDYDPLALSPMLAKGLIYNPPPLGKVIGKIYVDSVKQAQNGTSVGSEVFRQLDSLLN